MCLAIWKAADKRVTKEHLENGFNANNHGAGFAYPWKDKLHICKGFFKFEEFYKEYQKVEALPCLIHFRIRTSGGQDAKNCHPWSVTPELALIHNGIIRLKEAEGLSDTGTFAQYVLRPILGGNPEAWKLPGVQWLIEEAIGMGNKIVLMNNKGEHAILNEKQGDWEAGCWFSNTSFRRYRYSNDESWPRGHVSCSPCSSAAPRWQETSIPNVFLLSKEAADSWKRNDKPATSSTTSRAGSAGDSDILQAEIDRLKADGWVEWEVTAQQQS